MVNKEITFIPLGMVDYQQAWDYQEELFAQILEKKVANRKLEPTAAVSTPNFLLFCQHPHVYTLGKSGSETHLLLNPNELQEKEATFYKINRGGDITYHGPGQVVGYPILDLDNFFTDIHKYLRYLEEAVIRTLAEYKLNAGRIPGLTGVWLDYEKQENPRKICAMGVKCSRWVTMHGFALNVNTHLNYFNYIIPCGIPDKAVTSMQKELGQTIALEEVEEKLIKHLVQLFEASIHIQEDEKRYSV